MALSFDYSCSGCGLVKSNHEIDCFVCECGGNFKLHDSIIKAGSEFEPHYQETLGEYVSSWRDMEKKAARVRNEKHPEGFQVKDPKSKGMRELQNIRRHKEDYVREVYKKDGVTYRPGRHNDMPDKPKRKGTIFSFGS